MKAYALSLTYQELQPDGSYDGYVSFFSDGWQGIEGEGTEYRVYIDGNTTALYTLILILQMILNITAAAIAMKIVPAYVIQCCNKSPSAPFKLHDPLSAVQSCVYTSKFVHVVSCCNIVAELADDLPLRFHIIIHLCTQLYTRLVKGVKR